MGGERWHLGDDLLWHRKGWPDGVPGTHPATQVNPVTPRIQVSEMALVATSVAADPGPAPLPPDPVPVDPTPTNPNPPPPVSAPTGTRYFGACPDNTHAGASTTSATAVVTKYGQRASVRHFHSPSQGITPLPVHPASVSVVHTSWKASGTDAQLNAIIDATPNGDIIELFHESDVQRNSAGNWTPQMVLDRIAVKNHLYDLKQKRKPGVLVAHTTAAYLFTSNRTDAQRDEWFATARGDLIGIDCDGAHDTTGPTVGIDYGTAIANAKRYVTKYAKNGFIGYTVPEFGTSRQPWDTNGQARADWFAAQAAKMTGAYCVMVYDFNSGTHTTATDFNILPNPSLELTTMRNLVSANPR